MWRSLVVALSLLVAVCYSAVLVDQQNDCGGRSRNDALDGAEAQHNDCQNVSVTTVTPLTTTKTSTSTTTTTTTTPAPPPPPANTTTSAQPPQPFEAACQTFEAKRLKCGNDYTDDVHCGQLGCCWDQDPLSKTRCFWKQTSSSMCRRILGRQRQWCADMPFWTPSRPECEARGCCFDDSDPFEIQCFKTYSDVCAEYSTVGAPPCRRGFALNAESCYKTGCCYKPNDGCYAFPDALMDEIADFIQAPRSNCGK